MRVSNTARFVIAAALAVLLCGCSASKPQSDIDTPNVVVGERKTDEPYTKQDGFASSPIPPDEYSISAEVDWNEKTLSGVERIAFHNRSNTRIDMAIFNIYANAFAEPSMAPVFSEFYEDVFADGVDSPESVGRLDISAVSVGGREADFQQAGAVLRVVMPETMSPGDTVDITLKFSARTPQINHRVGYNDNAAWYGNFFPVVCPLFESGWYVNEYPTAGYPFTQLPANWTVAITADKALTVCGSGEESVIDAGDKLVTTMTAKLARDFAFAIGAKYEVDTVKTAGGVYINLYHYSPVDVVAAASAAEEAFVRANTYLGSYPFLSYDIIECGLFDSSESYAGLAFIDSKAFTDSSAALYISQEIYRQFFGEIVGGNRVLDPWLFEGMPSFLGSVVRDGDGLDARAAEMNRIGTNGVRVGKALNEYSDWDEYNTAQNVKAWLMFYNLRGIMGEEKFREFLREYYTTYSFKQASGADFIRLAQDANGASLKAFFDYWIDGDD